MHAEYVLYRALGIKIVTQLNLQIPINTKDKLTVLSSFDDWVKFKEVLTRFEVKSNDLIQSGRACLKVVPLFMLDIRSATNCYESL